MWRIVFISPVLLLSIFFGGCESLSDIGSTTSEKPYAIASNVNGTGVIQSVEVIPRSQGIGLGTLAGAAIGGVLGHQVGRGSGNTAATVAGAAGGAYVGHEMEKRRRTDNNIYKVTIRMDDGSTQSFAQEYEPVIHAGDRVKITRGVLTRL